jgi:hypothetical protein
MLGDNKAVLQKATGPSSMLKKKHNAIAYHRVCESIAGGILRFFHIPSTENLAVTLTKPRSQHLFHQITEALLFSHRNINIPTSVKLEPSTDFIPVAILCTRTDYESDNRTETFDSNLEKEPGIADTAKVIRESDLDIETVRSQQ